MNCSWKKLSLIVSLIFNAMIGAPLTWGAAQMYFVEQDDLLCLVICAISVLCTLTHTIILAMKIEEKK